MIFVVVVELEHYLSLICKAATISCNDLLPCGFLMFNHSSPLLFFFFFLPEC